MIEASAPIRICDIGGWTDTWFGAPGRVLNIAATPRVTVRLEESIAAPPVTFDLRTFDERYEFDPDNSRPRHPLIEAAVRRFGPFGMSLDISIESSVPPSCGTGTSAAVCVSLVGALARLCRKELTSREVAYEAFRLETDDLGLQSGIQDQLACALGGINYLEIEPFPDTTVEQLPAWSELGEMLSVVFLGRPHSSSEIHVEVLKSLDSGGESPFAALRDAANDARAAVRSRDLVSFGRSMIANNSALSDLHGGLVGTDARSVIDLAGEVGAIG